MQRHPWRLASTAALTALAAALTVSGLVAVAADETADPSPGAPTYGPPPVNAKFDYQIGGEYELPPGVKVVSRDWFMGSAPDGIYAICYINAFQTGGDYPDIDRPDERYNWPEELVLFDLGDDPNWEGEYLIDISTEEKRALAAAWVEPMVRTCRDKGFEAVEYDNLDSWGRFNDTPREDDVPFGRDDAIAYAELLADLAHGSGMAAAQKNTGDLPRQVSREQIGFDFAVVEDCGKWDVCQQYVDVWGDHIVDIEYRKKDFKKTCRLYGDAISVVLRDLLVETPDSDTYVYRDC